MGVDIKKISKRKAKVAAQPVIISNEVENTTINENTDIPSNSNIQYIIDDSVSMSVDEPDDKTIEPSNKKRGRKPKGGKIIMKVNESVSKNSQIANVILHLKCSLNDLNSYNSYMNQRMTDPLSYNPSVPPDIMTYNEAPSAFSVYTDATATNSESQQYAYPDKPTPVIKNSNGGNMCEACAENGCENDNDSNIDIKDINQKLKRLKVSLYKNTMPDKKSACFWCTYEYDNPTCYIPKYEIDGTIFGYGSFCRPECAVAFLMKENLDDSTQFERYHLLNQIYSKVYDYKKNIKPAPDPHFLLEKFYGNLSIQEYRKLLKSEHMLLVIDKPMTRILPELHEDTEEFILNIYGNNKNTAVNGSGIYKVKRQSEKLQGPTKTSIIRDKFGLSQ
jgi:hypothetical protein